MKRRVKILGAGSIGNHLAHASRSLGWDVVVVDTDSLALDRMRNEVYPTRYGRWDDVIQLSLPSDAPRGGFDIIFVGTPPESHLKLALEAVNEDPKAICVEKPACPPDLKWADELLHRAGQRGVKLFVGYDHAVGRAATQIERWLNDGVLGEIKAIDVEFRERWDGILRAHPWLGGVTDTYLAYWARGGGAGGEHSHALHLFQHFARLAGAGRVRELGAAIRYCNEQGASYDESFYLNLITESGLHGRVAQDTLAFPPRKRAVLVGTRAVAEWICNFSGAEDAVVLRRPGEPEELITLSKTRADDFKDELQFLDTCLEGVAGSSHLDLSIGLDTALVISAAHRSAAERRAMRIDYDKGYGGQAISPVLLEEES